MNKERKIVMRKDDQINIRINHDEKQRLIKAATKENLALGPWLLRLAYERIEQNATTKLNQE